MSASKTNFKTIFRATIRNTVLLANIFFVLLYVLGVLSTIVSPQKLLYLSYFGLFFPFIVAVNIFFIVFWMIKRRRYWLISLCLIVCTFYHANNVFTIPFGRLSKKSYNTEVKLLSYNISSLSEVKKFDDFIDFIDSVSPDIVCFQEFGFYQNDHNKNRLKNAMKKRFPFSYMVQKSDKKLFVGSSYLFEIPYNQEKQDRLRKPVQYIHIFGYSNKFGHDTPDKQPLGV